MGTRSTGSYPTSTKADGHLLRYLRNTFSTGGGSELPITSSGGTKFVIGSYTYHVFSSGSDNLTITGSLSGKTYDILVVGGGGAGGANMGAGGGAGGLIYHPGADASPLGNTTTPVVIGGGATGTPGGYPPGGGPVGANGVNTTFGTLYTALGGGGGNRYQVTTPVVWPDPSAVSTPGLSPTPDNQGASGGSGGGGGSTGSALGGLGKQITYSPLPAVSRAYGHGNDGGASTSYDTTSNYSRAGGGGAGGVGGGNAAPATGQPGILSWGWGGDGYQVPSDFMPTGFPSPVIAALGGIPTASPEWRYFAGGGGAGSNGGPATSGVDSNGKNRGGLGNNTGPSSTYEYGWGTHQLGGGADGCPGRGGGGGGGRWFYSTSAGGGAGGGGCVIIRISTIMV